MPALSPSQLTKLTSIVNGMVGTHDPDDPDRGRNNLQLHDEPDTGAGRLRDRSATADKAYISSAVSAGDTLGSSLQSARSSLWSTIWSASDSVRSAEVGASAAYATAVASYIQTVNNTIEGAVHTFNNARITADATWQRGYEPGDGDGHAGPGDR